MKVTQSCLTLSDIMDCSPPGSSIHGIFQASVLEWVALQCSRLQFNSWVKKIHWRGDRLPTPVFLGFPCIPTGKESTCNAGDLGSIPVSEDSLKKGKATHSSILAWRIPRTI